MPDSTEWREYVKLRRERDMLKSQFEDAERAYKEKQMALFEAMEADGTKTVRVDLGQEGEFTFSRRTTVYGRVIDQEQAVEALKASGHLHLLKTDFEKARLNEFVREHLEQGNPLPDGIDMREVNVVAISAKS